MSDFEKERFVLYLILGNNIFRDPGLGSGLFGSGDGSLGGLVEDSIDGITGGLNDFIKGILFGGSSGGVQKGAKGLNNEIKKELASANNRTSQQLESSNALINSDVTQRLKSSEGRGFFERLYDSTIGALLSAGEIAKDRAQSEFAEAITKSKRQSKRQVPWWVIMSRIFNNFGVDSIVKKKNHHFKDVSLTGEKLKVSTHRPKQLLTENFPNEQIPQSIKWIPTIDILVEKGYSRKTATATVQTPKQGALENNKDLTETYSISINKIVPTELGNEIINAIRDKTYK